MDVEMPEMNGLDALKLIMESGPRPVIMLSGINEQGMKETILALGEHLILYESLPFLMHLILSRCVQN